MTYPSLINYFTSQPIEDLTILNVGAGKSNSPISSPLVWLPVSLISHLDVYEPDLNTLREREHAAQHVTFHVHDLSHSLPFGDRAFALVVALDVIEHLIAERALRLITEMERVARDRVVIFAPLGPCPSFETDQPNPYQKHQSIWWETDLAMLGYKCDVLSKFHNFGHTYYDACFAWKDV